tara:strand:+ start:36 stop:536 length:501 start_codon:yes stop_codon:yes gene_type:complete
MYFEIKKHKDLVFKKINVFYFLIMLTVFFLDRISKNKVINDFNDERYFINDFLNIDLIWNIGIGFGLFSTDSSVLYNFITLLIGIVIIILLYFFLISENIEKFIYSLIIGGASGNLYDRISIKAVPDFIDVHYNNFHWFTFNVADIFISIGILTFIVGSFFVKNIK